MSAGSPATLKRTVAWLLLALAFVFCIGTVALGQNGPSKAPPVASARSSASAGATASSSAEAPPEKPEAPGAKEEPAEKKPAGKQQIEVGLYILAVPDLSLVGGYFVVDMYLWMRHRGGEELEQFELTNGEILNKAEVDRKKVGDQTYICFRIKAQLRASLSLARYPFDEQTLTIHLEHPALEADQLEYVPDLKSFERSSSDKKRWGMRDEAEVPQYDVKSTEFRVGSAIYKTDFGDPERERAASNYSQLVFEMHVARNYLPYCYKFLIPLITILGIAYLVFFLHWAEVCTSATLALTSLLSAVALNLTVSSGLPSVGYILTSDKFFICTYVFIFLSLAETVFTHQLARAGKEKLADKIERVGQIFYPVLVTLSFGLIFYI